ncbi:hypothetical protein [Ferruginibacter albus]|uniref:hypothetical protein n=1 Tax=Ferruginibacter albus TaxID=2875540 RepID=UPI001CC82131|nr:hypothetical protein [Ferruginibacter albus]UAY53211.1 hypothetical protein K9M53_05950 [Ferruginibacter albus]
MKFSVLEIETFDKEYSEIMEIKNENARISREALLSDVVKFGSFQPKAEIAKYLRRYHKDLMFFKSDDIINKLKEFGLKETELRWFISIDDINKEFDLIIEKDILIDKPKALFYIQEHLMIKFGVQIILWAAKPIVRDKVSMNLLSKYMFDLQKRREYAKGDPKSFKNVFDILMNSILKEIPNNESAEFTIKRFFELAKGKTEKGLLKKLINESFDHETNGLTKGKLLSTVYDLFQIILQDRFFENEDEFKEKKDYSINSYNKFKAHKMKKILSL